MWQVRTIRTEMRRESPTRAAEKEAGGIVSAQRRSVVVGLND